MAQYLWTRALVTGASAGIGEAIARLLAANGVNLVLVARDTERLEKLAAELTAAGRIEAEVLTADLTNEDQLAAVEARLAVAAPAVDLLVNNAGFGTMGNFRDLDAAGEAREVALNVAALHRLSHAAVTAMTPRGWGSVLNVSSMAGFQSMPGGATYGATKAFVTSFTEALHGECKGTGVSATALCPGFTRTEFQSRAGITEASDSTVPAFMWQSAEQVAKAGLDGAAAGKAIVVPGAINKLLVGVVDVLPRAALRALMSRSQGVYV